MPNITGGDSSGRDYAPHMWVLSIGGDPRNDSDHHFVGNSQVSYRPDGFYGSDYHLGVTSLNELVCDFMEAPADYREYTTTRIGLEAERIPEAGKKALIKVGLQQIATLAGNSILSALEVALPEDIELMDFGKLFNGTPEEQEAELVKQQQWHAVTQDLRGKFDIPD